MYTKTRLIGFTGAGGTGKTTTAEALGFNVPSKVDSIRKFIYGPESKYGDLKALEFLTFQDLILDLQIHLECMYRRKTQGLNSIIIPVERSTIDYAAYCLHLKEDNPVFFEKNQKRIKEYVKRCIDHANESYEGIVYFPINKFISYDNNSSKERDPLSISRTDSFIKELLPQLEIPVYELKSKTISTRVDEILGYFTNEFTEKK